jgi:hypothetical protein
MDGELHRFDPSGSEELEAARIARDLLVAAQTGGAPLAMAIEQAMGGIAALQTDRVEDTMFRIAYVMVSLCRLGLMAVEEADEEIGRPDGTTLAVVLQRARESEVAR